MKPREFWICDNGVCLQSPPIYKSVHVIEYAAFEKIKAENERLREYNRERFLEFIGVDPKNTCPGCGGIGEKCYSSTATWGGGIGGQALTNAVCDKCWGSGDAARPWANLKQIRIQQQVLTKERDALKAKLAEVEAELKKAQGIAWDRKCELRKEREAANVIREALEQLSRGRFSFGDMCEIIREALTKADEIRGEE